MQQAADQLTELLHELRQTCTSKNYRRVHAQILAAVQTERHARFDENPTAYIAAPVCWWPPGAPPDDIDVFWIIYAPGPYAGVDGKTDRRAVDTGLVVHHADISGDSILREHPKVDVLPHNMCFLHPHDATVFSRMMTLSQDMHMLDKVHTSVSETKRKR
jgi:hypothetical protein